MTHPLEDLRTFKFFALQHPKPMSFLREIIWQWNRGYAFAPGRLGEWVAMSLDQWSVHMGGVPRRTLQRWLKLLDDNGLIEREPHRFKGIKTLAFLRPTPLALKHMGKAGDLKRLTVPKTPPKKAPRKAGAGATGGVIGGATSGAVGGALDHTTLPSPSSHSSIQKNSHAHAHTGGEGKASGEGGKIKKKLILKKRNPKAPIPPSPHDDAVDVDTMIAAAKAKKLAKLLALFPILQGAHEKFVRHPYQMHEDKWLKWSMDLHKKRYAEYVQMVENWYAGKKGKAYKPLSYEDADFELDLDFPDPEEWLAMSKEEQGGWDGMTKPQQKALLQKVKAKVAK